MIQKEETLINILFNPSGIPVPDLAVPGVRRAGGPTSSRPTLRALTMALVGGGCDHPSAGCDHKLHPQSGGRHSRPQPLPDRPQGLPQLLREYVRLPRLENTHGTHGLPSNCMGMGLLLWLCFRCNRGIHCLCWLFLK